MQPNTVQSFDGHNINDGTDYRAWIQNAGALPAATNVWLEQYGMDSVDSGTFARAVRTPLVFIKILDYSDRHALGEQLKRWFRTGTRGTLVTEFADDSADYQLNCAVVNIIQDANMPTLYVAQLESGDSHWRAVSATAASAWQETGTGGSKVITVDGDETRLNATLTMSNSAGYLYQRLYRLVPPDWTTNWITWNNRPWCIELDTSVLVPSKMQSDCDDLRIIMDGVEVKRWIADPNTDHTKVWFNINFGRGYSFILKTAIASSGSITEIEFEETANTALSMKKLPPAGIFYHGTEWFHYTGKDVYGHKLTGVTRALYDTTMQAHSVSDVFYYIPHTILMIYGNSVVGDPADDDVNYDDDKPVFDLSSSDNTQWVYTASTDFYDPLRPKAPGSWSPYFKTLDTSEEPVSEYYWVKQLAESGDPAIGGKIGSFLQNGQWQTEDGRAGWMLGCEGGFDEITMTGQKYRSTERWPTQAGCQRSFRVLEWYNVFNESTPGSAESWTAVSQSAVSITNGATMNYLFVGVSGQIAALADAWAALEILTATIKFYTSNLPSGSLLSESGSGDSGTLDIILENETTGDKISIVIPVLMNLDLELDGENYEATFDGVNMHDALQLDDEGRSTWIRLVNGSNTITVTSPDVGTLDIDLSWYERRL